jgi:hypothetical protein
MASTSRRYSTILVDSGANDTAEQRAVVSMIPRYQGQRYRFTMDLGSVMTLSAMTKFDIAVSE